MAFSLFRRAAPAVAAALPKAKGRLVAGTALATLCCATLTGFEGVRLKAYIPIPGDVPTICAGETKGVRLGMTATKPQCEAMLLKRLSEDFAPAMEKCARQPMGDDQYAANLSLIYNIGEGAYCKSTVVRLWNAGDRRGSCRAFLAWDKAGGRVVAGLVKRRQAEMALCLKGI